MDPAAVVTRLDLKYRSPDKVLLEQQVQLKGDKGVALAPQTIVRGRFKGIEAGKE